MIGIAVFQAQIINLIEFMGICWSELQISDCGQLAYEQYYWFTLAELKQFILRVKTSHYTSNKNFSPLVLMDFLNQYAEERKQARYEHYSQQAPKVQFDPEAKPLTDEQMTQLTSSITDIARRMGEPVKSIESEEDYQRIRAEYNTRLMQDKAASGELSKKPKIEL